MCESLLESGRSLAPPTALNIHRQAINHFKVQHNVRIHKHSNLHEAISSLFHFVVTLPRCEANFLGRNFLSLRFACLIGTFSFSVKSPLLQALLLCCEHEAVFDWCYDITRHLTAIMTTITGVINLTSDFPPPRQSVLRDVATHVDWCHWHVVTVVKKTDSIRVHFIQHPTIHVRISIRSASFARVNNGNFSSEIVIVSLRIVALKLPHGKLCHGSYYYRFITEYIPHHF